MADQSKEHLSSTSEREAIDWLIRLIGMASESDTTPETRREMQDQFEQWVTRSAENLRSFLEAASVFEALGECETELIHEMVRHIEAPGNTPSSEKPPLAEPPASVAPPQERIKRFWGLARTLVAAVLLLTLGVLLWRRTDVATYHTQPGEWRRIRIADGSVVILGENSQIEASLSGGRRTVMLRRGHALFDVARDAHRPFFVVTANADIQALGTRFDVEYHGGSTRVTVVGGSVLVSSDPDAFAPSHVLTLKADEGAEVSSRNIVVLDKSQVENVVASQRDVLVFDNEPISVVATRVNFASRRQIRFLDPSAGQKPISGRYVTDHPEELMLAIQALYPDLEIRLTDDEWLVSLRSRGNSRTR